MCVWRRHSLVEIVDRPCIVLFLIFYLQIRVTSLLWPPYEYSSPQIYISVFVTTLLKEIKYQGQGQTWKQPCFLGLPICRVPNRTLLILIYLRCRSVVSLQQLSVTNHLTISQSTYVPTVLLSHLSNWIILCWIT